MMSRILLAWRLAALAPKPSGKKTSLAFNRARPLGVDGLSAQTVSLVRVHLSRPRFICLLFLSLALILPCTLSAATFSGSARVEVADSTGGLSWNTGNNVLSVSCWFKMAIPSGTNLTEDMTILVNRRGGTPGDAHSYRIFFNINSGNIEFTARGANGYTNVLIERPYLERWYHVAVVREGEVFTGYADGRQVFSAAAPQLVGDARSTDGVSIGGWGGSRNLYGEVQEVAVYQSALDRNSINQYMFSDQPTNNEPGIDLKGYFKLGYAANTADSLRNLAPAPVPAGSEAATTNGPIQFEETNQAGEQSTFDSRRNGGPGCHLIFVRCFLMEPDGVRPADSGRRV